MNFREALHALKQKRNGWPLSDEKTAEAVHVVAEKVDELEDDNESLRTKLQQLEDRVERLAERVTDGTPDVA